MFPLAIVAVLPVVAAWWKWWITDRASLRGLRKVLFWAGLCAATASLTEYCFFALYTIRVGGFGDNFGAMLAWARPGLWVSLCAVVLVTVGHGKSRAFGIASSLLLLVLWIIPVEGM